MIGETLIDIDASDDHGAPIEMPGGSPANVALGLGRLGESVRLHTALGRDERGRRAAAHLEESGVRIDDSSYSLDRTSTARFRRDPDGNANYSFDIQWAIAPPDLSGESVVHVGSIACALEPGASAVVEFLAGLPDSATLTFDPNIRPDLITDRPNYRAVYSAVLERADVVKMSDEDAAWIYPGRDATWVLRTLLRGRATVAIITMGGRGAMVAVPGAIVEVPAPVIDVADTVGAGDTFMASLISSVLESGCALTEERARAVARSAVAAASLTATRQGANLPTRQEIAIFLAALGA